MAFCKEGRSFKRKKKEEKERVEGRIRFGEKKNWKM